MYKNAEEGTITGAGVETATNGQNNKKATIVGASRNRHEEASGG
jgi:hypothetical protein